MSLQNQRNHICCSPKQMMKGTEMYFTLYRKSIFFCLICSGKIVSFDITNRYNATNVNNDHLSESQVFVLQERY